MITTGHLITALQNPSKLKYLHSILVGTEGETCSGLQSMLLNRMGERVFGS